LRFNQQADVKEELKLKSQMEFPSRVIIRAVPLKLILIHSCFEVQDYKPVM